MDDRQSVQNGPSKHWQKLTATNGEVNLEFNRLEEPSFTVMNYFAS